MPSFLKSTLSLAFIACTGTVIAMIFLWLEMPDYWEVIIGSIVSAYLTARWNYQQKKGEDKEPEDIHSLTSLDWG